MISATALNASSVPLNKSPQMPLGLDNSRLRVDSQKFLVPSLPVSSRQLNPRTDHHTHHHNPHLHYQQQLNNAGGSVSDPVGASKRRERSILNGTAHPIPPHQENRLGTAGLPTHGINGIRRPTSPLGGRGSSPNYHHMQSSPRKDAHSPMYAGEVTGFSGSPAGSTFSPRSSVPIPCSSPSPGSSASPKSSHSLSPNNGGGGSSSAYSPHLPPGLSPSSNGASELSQLAVAAAAAAAASGAGRLYPPGFPPPSAAHHAAFYAAAAAAAGHSLPYPSLFGSHYPPHQHPAAAAAANSYLDFHSKLLRNSAAAVAAVADLRSPSQSPPSRSYHPVSPHQQQQQQQHPPHMLQSLESPQSTSVTSLHTKLIESVSAAGDRYHPHHTSHNHNHIHSSGNGSQQQQQHGSSHGRFNPAAGQPGGVSKGGPLGISGGIMGLSISPNSNSPHKGHAGQSATPATADMSSKSVGGKLYMEHPGLSANSSGSSQQEQRRMFAEAELINGNKAAKESLLAKQRMMTRSPDEFSSNHQHAQPHPKIAKSISFASDVHSGGIHRPQQQQQQQQHHSYMNGHGPSHHAHHHPQHSLGHHLLPPSVATGPTNLSTDSKRVNGSSGMQTPPGANNNTPQQQHQNHLFLPPSPKKRSAHWNFVVPQSPMNNGKLGEHLLHPPPPPSTDSLSESASMLNHHTSPSKYLSQSQQNQKPSNGGPGPSALAGGGGCGSVATGVATAGNQYHQSTNAQQLLVVPSSPLLSSSPSSHGGSSGPSTPKSPAVHFKFFSSTNKENNGTTTTASGRNGRILNMRNDSSSSASSIELGGNGKTMQNLSGPWPVEQMPLISAFRKGSMIKLASGEMKTVEELKEEDFEKAVQMMSDSVKIVYCPVISIQDSVDCSHCKVTLAMGAAQNQQVVVESTPEQPFFIRGRGWSSSSPKLTEKLLQLPCATLAVGDICITLTRHVRSQSNSTSLGGTGSQQNSSGGGRGSKSKSGGTRPYGSYSKSRNSSTSSILKSSHQQQRGNNVMRMNGRKLVSGPTTNQDVSNSSPNSSSKLRANNNMNPIISTRPATEKVVVAPPPSDNIGERQDKLVTGEKEVDLSLTRTAAPSNAPTTPTETNCSISTSQTIPMDSSSSSANSSAVSKESSWTAAGVTVAAISCKRKSISPCPTGSMRSGGAEDESMRPTSPKKRRWSAPDQIEVESQQALNSGILATNISSTQPTVTTTTTIASSTNSTVHVAVAVASGSEYGGESVEQVIGIKDGGNAQPEDRTCRQENDSNERTKLQNNNNIAPEKA